MIRFFYLFLFINTISNHAYAACSSPAGVTGQFIYQSNDYIHCDGAVWTTLTNVVTGTACAAGDAGKMTYTSPDLNFCNGSFLVKTNSATISGASIATNGTIKYNSVNKKMEVSHAGNWYILGPVPMIITWKTDNSGSSAANQAQLPLAGGSIYNFVADWGDGTTSAITSNIDPDALHTYGTAGTYTIKLTGQFESLLFNGGDKLKILAVTQWGSNKWKSMATMFAGANNLSITATDAPDLSGVTSLNSMFSSNTGFNSNISSWDVSKVTNFEYMFAGATSFNQSLNAWNVGKAYSFYAMFRGATSFNQALNSWNTGELINAGDMFKDATAFNQSLNAWNVTKLEDIGQMFMGATSFNQPLNGWVTTKLKLLTRAFSGATAFNQNLNSWNTSLVTSFSGTFEGATAFNGDITTWNTSSALNMSNIFNGATVFNKPLRCSWNVSSGPAHSNYDLNATAWTNCNKMWPSPACAACP